eukprot:gene11726-1782_t
MLMCAYVKCGYFTKDTAANMLDTVPAQVLSMMKNLESEL